MIDDTLLLLLELCALALLIGAGVWRIYRPRLTATNDPSAPVAHDMRQDGQQLEMEAPGRRHDAGDRAARPFPG